MEKKTKTIETYQYSREAIKKALEGLNHLADAQGIDKAETLLAVFNIINRAIKEDTVEVEVETD